MQGSLVWVGRGIKAYLGFGVIWFMVGMIVKELQTNVWYWNLAGFLWWAAWLVAVCVVYHGTRYLKRDSDMIAAKLLDQKVPGTTE